MRGLSSDGDCERSAMCLSPVREPLDIYHDGCECGWLSVPDAVESMMGNCLVVRDEAGRWYWVDVCLIESEDFTRQELHPIWCEIVMTIEHDAGGVAKVVDTRFRTADPDHPDLDRSSVRICGYGFDNETEAAHAVACAGNEYLDAERRKLSGRRGRRMRA